MAFAILAVLASVAVAWMATVAPAETPQGGAASAARVPASRASSPASESFIVFVVASENDAAALRERLAAEAAVRASVGEPPRAVAILVAPPPALLDAVRDDAFAFASSSPLVVIELR